MRFQSRLIRLFCTYIGMFQTLLYMGVVLFAPSIALETVAGIPLWVSVVVSGVVGTIYTSLGGMRSVVWTDVFQWFMLYGGVIAILAVGIQRVGGIPEMMDIANSGKRIVFDEYSFDPRVRHSIASTLIGSCFSWLPNICNQASIQRICSMRSKRDARNACFLVIPIAIIFQAPLILSGILLYSYFQLAGCDPIANGDINNANQVMPYFVMHVLNNLPGVPGLFIAALLSGAMSSYSSLINSMAANTVEDIFGEILKNKSQSVCTLVAKLVVFVYGGASIGLAFLVTHLPGPVTQITMTIVGATGGPIAGIFFLGAMFPQANWIGALVGCILSICVTGWIAVGSVLYGNKAQLSPPVTTAFCDVRNATFDSFQTTAGSPFLTSSSLLNTTSILPIAPTSTSGHLAIYDVTYLYISVIGFLVSVLVGILVSAVTGMDKSKRTEAKFLFPWCRRIWKLRQYHVPEHLQKPGDNVSNWSGGQYELRSAITPLTTTDTVSSKLIQGEQL